jgi:hypothetical protein
VSDINDGERQEGLFASLFGFKDQSSGGQQLEEKERPPPQQQYYQGTRVRPRNDDEDDYYGRYGYGDRDIDKKATEFIERVHQAMRTNNDQDG